MTKAISNENDRFLEWYKKQFGKNYTEGGMVKTDAISDKDYETGNALYQGYLQKENLANQYNASTKQLEENTARQRQEASVLRDKMAKYLNLQNKNNGLNNLGVSESVGLQADAMYANNLGNIEANANAEKTALLNSYLTNKTNIDSAVATNEQNILNKYQQFAREDEQKAYDRQQDEYNKQKYEQELQYQREQDAYNKQKAEEETAYQREQDAYEKQKYEEELAYQKQQDEYNKLATKQQESFNEFMAAAESGTFNTAKELEQFYSKVKNNLSEQQQAIAEQYINYYKNNPDQQQMDKETEANKTGVIKEVENADGSTSITTRDEEGQETTITTDKDGNVIDKVVEDSEELAEKKEAEKTQRILEGKEYVEYNGKNYQIKSQLDTNANELRMNDSFTRQLNELGFTNPFDPNIPDGTTFDIKVDAVGKDTTNAWDWIAGFLTLGISTLGMQAIYNKTVTYYKGNWYVSEKK